ncbi:shikimate kinase [Leucobacter chromiiresistens]|uniref:Shikimate kinase n=1 Tax=Leucobacter chromiiresistens TaxID=1079994 RepID=A0A1H1A3K2_9MICO|nr:shikimate kinase [Leucobacter chromiiresistens]SDQ34264.1 shikimate kinase [Leucobacter chromiiresistens]
MSGHRRVARDAGPPEHKPKPSPPTSPLQVIPTVAEEPLESPSKGAKAARSKRRRRRRRPGAQLPDRAIVFVGPMAAGKTSLGKRVARELGVPFVDTDAVIVRRHGPINDFFASQGEAEFRRVEAEVIAEELGAEGCRIVALGGGAVLTESTRALLARHPVVLLMTTQEAVLRTANLARRPLLRDDPQAWGRILQERRPLYEAVADVTYRTDRATQEQLVRRVAQWARNGGRHQRTARRGEKEQS